MKHYLHVATSTEGVIKYAGKERTRIAVGFIWLVGEDRACSGHSKLVAKLKEKNTEYNIYYHQEHSPMWYNYCLCFYFIAYGERHSEPMEGVSSICIIGLLSLLRDDTVIGGGSGHWVMDVGRVLTQGSMPHLSCLFLLLWKLNMLYND